MDNDYEMSPRISYEGNAMFIRVCPVCGRFVKANKTIIFHSEEAGGQPKEQPNATCSKCGRVSMPFEGYY